MADSSSSRWICASDSAVPWSGSRASVIVRVRGWCRPFCPVSPVARLAVGPGRRAFRPGPPTRDTGNIRAPFRRGEIRASETAAISGRSGERSHSQAHWRTFRYAARLARRLLGNVEAEERPALSGRRVKLTASRTFVSGIAIRPSRYRLLTSSRFIPAYGRLTISHNLHAVVLFSNHCEAPLRRSATMRICASVIAMGLVGGDQSGSVVAVRGDATCAFAAVPKRAHLGTSECRTFPRAATPNASVPTLAADRSRSTAAGRPRPPRPAPAVEPPAA